MNSKLIFVFGLVAVFAVIGSHATSATDKARAAAEKAAGDAADYVSDKVDRAQKLARDTLHHHEDDSLLDKAKHAVRDAAGNIIGGGIKSSAKAGMAAGAAKMAYDAAHKIKERVWDDDEEDLDPEQRARNDRLRKACRQRSSSKSAAEECYKDAKDWNELESEVDANGPSMYSRVRSTVGGAYDSAKEYVTGEKKQEEKKGWL